MARDVLNATELTALIMKRLAAHEECKGIASVGIEPSGYYAPMPTWNSTDVVRHPGHPVTSKEGSTFLAVIKELRAGYDLARA